MTGLLEGGRTLVCIDHAVDAIVRCVLIVCKLVNDMGGVIQ